MKIIAVIGSTRNGNTKYMVEKIIDGIKREDARCDVQKIYLRDIKMEFCDGCLVCDETGECVINDDMSKIVAEIRKADGFIFASPARWALLSGEMKTFFDRLNPLAVKEEMAGKLCVNIVIGQSEEDGKESIESAADSLKAFCNDAGIEIVDTVIACGCYGATDIVSKTIYVENGIFAGKKLLEKLQR